MRELEYFDNMGRYYTKNGAVITDINSVPLKDRMTQFDWMLKELTAEAERNGYIEGLFD
jgi:hypothetical protein